MAAHARPAAASPVRKAAASVALLLSLVLGAAAAAPAQEPRGGLYTVVLETPSVGRQLAVARARGGTRPQPRRAAASFQSLAKAVRRSQDPVVAAVEAEGAQVVRSVGHVLSAVFVRATRQQAESIAALDGVAAVVPSRRVELSLGGVAEVVGLNALRRRPGGSGATGEGVRIGIIDSGLDFEHEAFRDDSLPALPGYPKGRPEHRRFMSRKVIAVRSYARMLSSGLPETSTPDDETPRDQSGHGTAVAMIAAGRRVESPAGSVEGVAPRAYLGIYKVSGTPGINAHPSSEAVIAAIDDAVVDGMDVINLSLGSPALFPWYAAGGDCGEPGSHIDCDPLAVAAQSAVVDFGRVVVAAAGNAGADGVTPGPASSTVSSPAIAPDVIAVAATSNGRRLRQAVSVEGRRFAALSGSGPEGRGVLTAPMALAREFGTSHACESFAAGALTGRILVAERGECWFLDKVENADAAGAAGVVVFDPAGTEELIRMAQLEGTDIPAYFVGTEAGGALSQLAGGPNGPPVPLTLDPAPESVPADWTSVSPASSRGPTPGLNLKPDVAAPGQWVYSAAARPRGREPSFRFSGFAEFTGTSFAAPVVAGAAALVWQRHPGWEAREVASALINTASSGVLEAGQPARVTSVGGGLLDLEAALDPLATVDPPTVGFGRFGEADLPVWQEIWVTNRTSADAAYRLEVRPTDPDSRARVTVDGFGSVDFRLAPDEYKTLRVLLEGSQPGPGAYQGHLALTRSGARSALRVPYLYVVGGGAPANAFSVSNGPTEGLIGEGALVHLAGKFVDASGAPAAGQPVSFEVRAGDARILHASATTDAHGVAAAEVRFGASPFEQEVVASGFGLEIPFVFHADVPRPLVESVADLASGEAGWAVAPGGLISVFGSGFAEFSGKAPGGALPLVLKGVSAGFDFPELGLSVPARVLAVDPRQVWLQVPWELAGLNFAHYKVRVASRSGERFATGLQTLDLADVAPAIFVSYSDFLEPVAMLEHPGGAPVTVSDPARRGASVVAYMTGNGPLERPPETGFASALPNPTVHWPEVSVGDAPAEVTYSGSVPGLVGMYQVRFVVPAGAPSGLADLTVAMHGATSNTVPLPVR